MKLVLATSALSLLPSAFGFAPLPPSPSQVLAGRTLLDQSQQDSSSSLQMSFLSDLFSDRSDEEAEKKSLWDRFKKPLVGGVVINEQSSKDEKMQAYANKSEENFDYLPTKEMTGVETHMTRLCATISLQLYELNDGRKDAFLLNTDDHKTEVLLLDMQVGFESTNPTFGIAVSGDTMILGWRGTDPKTITDVFNDLACSPTSSLLWRKHKQTLKVQGAMASLVNNDLAKHEDMIIEECKKRGIKEIVTTGHSLGGGLGQIAHTTIRAQIQEESSPWAELKDTNVRSVVFSAPMTTVLINNASEETDTFIDEVNDNSCNLIFSNDPVPRAYGYLTFINDFVEDAADQIADKVPIPSTLKWAFQLQGKLEDSLENVIEGDIIQDIVATLSKYVHPGKIVYYEDKDSKPVVLKDMGAFYKNTKGRKDTFRSVPYKTVGKPLDEVMSWHNDIRAGLGYDDSLLH